MGRFTFRLPDVGEGTAEAEIVAWHVAVGDVVEEDQPLVDVMTDKATVEITSPVAGQVVARRGEPGEMFSVGGALVEFDTEAEPASGAIPVVPNPSGQRNVEAREAPPTTPAMDRPSASSNASPPPAPSRGGDYAFRLPDLGEGTAEAEIIAWRVSVGDMVEEDQPLVDVMTDKATVEITSPVAGRVVSVHGEAGAMFPVGGVLARFQTAARSPAPAAPAAPPAESKPAATASAAAPAFFRSDDAKVLTSPAIRRRAREAGMDLRQVQGSGPEGRITREDFDAHAKAADGARPVAKPQAPPTPGEVEEIRVIGLRRKIAQQMSEAKRRIPALRLYRGMRRH